MTCTPAVISPSCSRHSGTHFIRTRLARRNPIIHFPTSESSWWARPVLVWNLNLQWGARPCAFHSTAYSGWRGTTQGTEITDFVTTNVLSSLGLPGILRSTGSRGICCCHGLLRHSLVPSPYFLHLSSSSVFMWSSPGQSFLKSCWGIPLENRSIPKLLVLPRFTESISR